MQANRDYVADHRQYGSTGRVTGGGWCVMWWDGKRQIWEEGAPHSTKTKAVASMREEHKREDAASTAARALRAIPSDARSSASRANGARPVKPGSKPRGRPKGKRAN